MIADDSKYLIEIISYFDIYIVFCHNLLIIISKFIPCFEDEALGAVFAVLAQLVVFLFYVYWSFKSLSTIAQTQESDQTFSAVSTMSIMV